MEAGKVYLIPFIGNLFTFVYFSNFILTFSGRLFLSMGKEDAIVW